VTRIQFILKHRENDYGGHHYGGGLSSGLANSARLVQEMLRDVLGYTTELVHAIDNNCIDRLVTAFKPDIVVIEAYWVVPEKFPILAALHPNVTWVIRNHSAFPFAAMEGKLVDWSLRYMDTPRVILASNDPRADKQFRGLIALHKPGWTSALDSRCVLLANYYPVVQNPRHFRPTHGVVNVGCFGAIRPLKNHLMQAVAALEFAQCIGKRLRFHINASRIEGKGEPILHNLRGLFDLMPADLVEHPWLSHDEFLSMIRHMDVGMQVSFSETFNIVTADMLVNGVPSVVSDEVRWVAPQLRADPNNAGSIVLGLARAYEENTRPRYTRESLRNLSLYDQDSVRRWSAFIESVVERDSHAGA
jgi:hypothetical protein